MPWLDSLLPGLVVRRRRRPFTLGVHRGGLLGHRRPAEDEDGDEDAVVALLDYYLSSPFPSFLFCCVYVRNLG